MRAFVAVDLATPPELAALVPTMPRHFHLTLRFFPDLPEPQLGACRDAMSIAAATEPPFRLGLWGIGAFPSSRDPRVVWVGIDAGRSALVRLADRLARALREAGLGADDRPFSPHATLFRVRGGRDRERAARLLTDAPASDFGTQPVGALLLFASRLGPGGADHVRLAQVPLVGAL